MEWRKRERGEFFLLLLLLTQVGGGAASWEAQTHQPKQTCAWRTGRPPSSPTRRGRPKQPNTGAP